MPSCAGLHHNHREELYAGVQQSAINVAGDMNVNGTDCFEALDLTVTPINESQAREDSKRGRDIKETQAFERGPHGIAINGYTLPHGVAGSVPDLDPIYDNMFTKALVASDVTMTGSPTDRVFTTSDIGILFAGYIINVPIAVGSSICEAAVIDSVSLLSSVETITLKWSLSFTPLVATVIGKSVQYSPRECPDPAKFVTIYKKNPTHIDAVAGCMGSSFETKFDRGDFTSLSIELLGRHKFGGQRTTLDGGIDDAILAMKIDNAAGFYGIDSNHPLYFDILDAAFDVAETVRIDLVNDDTDICTIARAQKGTSAVSHLTDAVIRPWFPTPATNGQAISGVTGQVYFGDFDDVPDDEAATAFGTMSWTTTTAENPVAILEAGDDELTGWESSANREVSVEADAIGKWTAKKLHGLQVNRAESHMLNTAGTTQGKTFSWYTRRFILNEISEAPNPGDIVNVPLASKYCLSTSETGSVDNSFNFAFM